MKKGFTLIELLIVMVIVGMLVTVALPKYQASMERGRSLEGINNLSAVSNAINAHYVMNGNAYPDDLISEEERGRYSANVTKSRHFGKVSISSGGGGASIVVLSIARENGNEMLYMLRALNQDGELKKIICEDPGSVSFSSSSEEEWCERIGMEKVDGAWVIDYTVSK